MKRYSIFIALVLVLVITASLTNAQPCNRGNQKFQHPHKGIMDIPDLTAEQKKQIQKLRLEHQKDVLPLKTKLKAAKLDMQSLILEEADQKTIDKKIEEIGKIKIELAKKKNAHRMKVRNLLTDEQKSVFDAHRMGKGHGGCFGLGKCCGMDAPKQHKHRR